VRLSMGSTTLVNRRSFMGNTIWGALGGAGIANAIGCSAKEAPTATALPYFSLQTPSGNSRNLEHYANQPLLMNFWATWCEPCRREMSDLEGLHRQWAPKGLNVVAVSVDSDTHLVREFLLRESITFTVLLDPLQSLSKDRLNIRSFPTTLLVNREGEIRERILGERAWLDETVQRAVAEKTGIYPALFL
jgi:thiol-disulfide isomerase/thioredoxin